MKKLGLFISMLFSLLIMAGCSGGSSSGGKTGNSLPVFFSPPSGVALCVGDVFDPDDPAAIGVTAWDDEDGDLTDDIVVESHDVNTSVEGNYTISYSVTDFASNTSYLTLDIAVVTCSEGPIDSSDAIEGDALACTPSDTDGNETNDFSDDANETEASLPFKRNVSTASTDDIDSRKLQTSHSDLTRLSMVMAETSADGNKTSDTKYHPIVVHYLEHVEGSDYEMGDGSADIGDPDNVDRVMLALTRDNGQTWKHYPISDTSDRSSKDVMWAGEIIEYPGDAQKPTMAVHGQYIMVAWNDKLCNGNPLDLPSELDPETNKTIWPTDIFAVNGPQGSIDYGEEDDETGVYVPMIAPNGKLVYEVPFSCVWTARGIINPDDGNITWHAPMQLTAGVRDSNHIRLAGSDAGFAIAWQEDIMGLKSGQGAGPGEGWSGATTNRGSDIWYTSIPLGVDGEYFAAIGEDDNETNRSKSLNNFHYPVRVTDNEQCQDTDAKDYCDYFCTNYGSITVTQGNESNDTVTRCLTYDTDMLTDTKTILDGDTGASRPALKIVATNAPGEHVVLLGYEETKALKERTSGEGDQDQGDIPTDIAVEGKSVYFESFDFTAMEAFDHTDISSIQTTPMPIVSAGGIINVQVPRSDDTQVGTPGDMIYENARRLVIGGQIDGCDADEPGELLFAILYKQSFEVQGASSDMFVRTWRGFDYNDTAELDGLVVTNVSAQVLSVSEGSDPADYNVTWSEDNLDDNTYENDRENTFSPRIFLRGENINIGYAYTPYEPHTGEAIPLEGAIFPSNFHTNLYVDGTWTGPVNVTKVVDRKLTTLDPRFFTTPKGSFDTTKLESDKSNPNVLFVTWGTAITEGEDTTEADLFFRRSTDYGLTWEDEQNLSSIQRTVIEEKEVNSFASPDGKHIYNVWLQQSEQQPGVDSNATLGLDTWFGRVDYNITVDQ